MHRRWRWCSFHLNLTLAAALRQSASINALARPLAQTTRVNRLSSHAINSEMAGFSRPFNCSVARGLWVASHLLRLLPDSDTRPLYENVFRYWGWIIYLFTYHPRRGKTVYLLPRLSVATRHHHIKAPPHCAELRRQSRNWIPVR